MEDRTNPRGGFWLLHRGLGGRWAETRLLSTGWLFLALVGVRWGDEEVFYGLLGMHSLKANFSFGYIILVLN